jgi:hypothetical protein
MFHGVSGGVAYFPFNMISTNFWTSTTNLQNTAAAFHIQGSNGTLNTSAKTSSYRIIATRTFTVSGTTLT